MAGYEAWLRGLGQEGLAALLRRRPEILREGQRPQTVHALATLLLRPHAVHAALLGENAATVDVAAAALVLGRSFRRDELAELLGEPDHVAPIDVDAALRRLQDLALVWPDEADGWDVTGGLRAVFERPFGLGPPLHRLVAQVPEADLRSMAAGMGVPRNAPVRHLRHVVETRLSDPDHVRAAAAGGPQEAAAALSTLVWHDSLAGLLGPPLDDLDDVDAEEAETWMDLVDQLGTAMPWQHGGPVLTWLRESGMLLRDGWEEHMPREVALALRGPHWRPPVSARPPVVEVDVSPVGVRGDGAAAASALVHDASRLVAAIGDQPVARLRSSDGGVGVREVKRLARATHTEPRRVDLLLPLLHGRGLLHAAGDRVTVTERAHAWRHQDPARQLTELLTAWWTAEGGLTHRPDHRSGKQAAVLSWVARLTPQQPLRHAVLRALAGLPEGRGTTGPDGVHDAVVFDRPLASPASPELDEILAALWWEAGVLGLVGASSATPLGRALACDAGPETADGAAVLLAATTAALPPVTRTAVVQGDLTALVHGVAAAAVTDLLNGCADVEGAGGSTRWRFSESSVRRALDTGVSAEDLLTRLADVAEHDLPQPLVYLVKDVGRRHGRIRVTSLRCAVVATDETLIAEVLHARPLRTLGLRRLVDGVLASAQPAAETTDALRRAGFMPVQEDDCGRVVLHRSATQSPHGGAPGRPVDASGQLDPDETIDLSGPIDLTGRLDPGGQVHHEGLLDPDVRAWFAAARGQADDAEEDLDAAERTAIAVLRG